MSTAAATPADPTAISRSGRNVFRVSWKRQTLRFGPISTSPHRRYADRPAFVFLTASAYRELFASVEKLAGWLAARWQA